MVPAPKKMRDQGLAVRAVQIELWVAGALVVPASGSLRCNYCPPGGSKYELRRG